MSKLVKWFLYNRTVKLVITFQKKMFNPKSKSLIIDNWEETSNSRIHSKVVNLMLQYGFAIESSCYMNALSESKLVLKCKKADKPIISQKLITHIDPYVENIKIK